jgi:putative endonuclease
MKFFVYILYSASTNKYYVGQTVDLDERIILHNTGEFSHSFTKPGIPWQLYHFIECKSKKQSVAIETHIKRMKSIKYYQSLKNYPEIVKKLLIKYAD